MIRQIQSPPQQLRSASGRYAGAWRRWTSQSHAREPFLPRTTPAEPAPPSDEMSSSLADQDLPRLEAVLFLAREPLSSRKLAQYANLADGTQARTLVRLLNEQYDAAGRAFRVEQVAGGYQLLTRRAVGTWLRRLAHVRAETRLSAPALETLAVIAYRQPVPRSHIEAIRGVNCGEILRQLMERDLVKIGGRSQELGRPYLYATTKQFLELFGLNQIDELPHARELRLAPLPAEPSTAPPAGVERESVLVEVAESTGQPG